VKNSSRNSYFLASNKPSRYNITVVNEDQSGIIYNSLSGARVAVPQHTLTIEQIRALEAEEWPDTVELPEENTLRLLEELKFFIPREMDELGYVIANRRSHSHNPDLRRVNVILTRKCNLGCTYCFQDKDVGDSKASEEMILRYLKSQAIPGGLLQITWFGGEPTLRIKLICELSDEVIATCNERGTRYNATISTNGVLLDDEKIQMLVARHVKYYQISLDGPQQVQEARRPSLSGKSTYEIIIHNVERLVRSGAEVLIKVILDRENYEAVPDLFRDLGTRGLLQSVKIALQHTEAKHAARGYDKRFASLDELSAVKLHLYEVLAREGYGVAEPSQRPEFCSATSPYSTMVDMAGKLFRCSTEEDNVTGFLAEKGERAVLTNISYEEMFTKRRFALQECESCKVLPICGGGCTVAAENLADRDICSFYKVGIKDYLTLLGRHDRNELNGHTAPAS